MSASRASEALFVFGYVTVVHSSREPNGIIVALLAKNDFSPDITS